MQGDFITGGRLSLEPFIPSQVSPRYLGWMNDSLVSQFLESRHYVHTIETLQNFVASVLQSENSYLFRILSNSDSQHIGNIKVGSISPHHKRAEIGILIGERDYWGQGLASEAIELVTNYCFTTLDLHKVTAGCYSSNEGSRRAFETAGYSVEAVQKEQFLDDDGNWNSGIILARFKD